MGDVEEDASQLMFPKGEKITNTSTINPSLNLHTSIALDALSYFIPIIDQALLSPNNAILLPGVLNRLPEINLLRQVSCCWIC